MATTARWLQEFLRGRNLVKPDGRPLFEYRTREAEFASLQALVSETLFVSAHDCGAFCLYAAEWWRRHGEGLTFKGLLESLGWDCSYTELYGEIEQGLRYWGRHLRIVRTPTRSWRDFVGSLSREGGLPLQLLLDSQTSIRRFFRQLLQIQSTGVEVTAKWAEVAAIDLPKAWRHPDIYELAPALVNHIWQLRKSVAHAEQPVLELDRVQTGWQERLPILVDSDVAAALVRGLVEDAQKIATSGRLGLTVETRLMLRNGEWSFQRVLQPPRRMQPRELWKLLDLDPQADDNPRRVRILIDDGSGPRPLAIATQWKADDPFELVPLVEGALVSFSATELVVLADTVSEAFPGKLLRGGERLDHGPWVFIADGQDEGGGEEWKLIAQGSARVRSSDVLVALPANCPSTLRGTEPHGQLITHKGVRALVRVTGGPIHINDVDSGERYVVEASASEDDAQAYRFEGPLFGEELRPPVWRGVPRVYEEPMFGVRREVHPRDLEWRPKHGGHTWARLSDACRGHVEIRLRRGGTTAFARSLLIVPKATVFEIRPTSDHNTAELLLDGTEASHGLLRADAGFEVVSLADSGNLAWAVTSTDDAPARVQVQLRWTESRAMKLWLPFPKVGIRFIDNAGRVLPNDATVALDNLRGCRVEALLPRHEPHPFVEAKLKSATDRPGGFVSDSNFAHKLRLLSKRGAPLIRRFALDLSRLVDDVGLRLAGTTELNAFVRLVVQTRTGKTRLNVRRFPLSMMVTPEHTGVMVLPDKSETFVDELVMGMELHRIPIRSPDATPVSMERSPAGWTIGLDEDNAETWLVIGSREGRCCARPVIWHPPRDSGPAPELDDISTLTDAVGVAWKQVRLAAISKVLDELIADPSHPEWTQLTPFLGSLATLPATTYDVLDVAVRKPTLCVYTLIDMSPSVGLQPLWTALEQLSFAWKLVPVKAWIAGFRLWWARIEADVAKLDEGLQPIVLDAARNQLASTLSAIEARLHGFTIVRELIECALLGAEPGQYMQFLAFPGGLGRAPLLEGRDEARMNLFRTHADDRSWPSFQAARDLLDEFPGQVPKSLLPLGVFANKIREKTRFVTYAPVQAAIAAACGLKLNPEQIFALRQLEAFDNTWFDHCYEASLAAAIGIMLESDPETFQ
ncbi:STY4851/ECs_5259 family protein [Enhygromyxa salina]|uniref:Uncharacterized protein n=1 Tax=Enhygromyxa salina TaxID=215803 RepID=A0A2S9YN37_9BACT|nr:STY4851/ECs_5259 family protein [Enhygromyxa salina]PRQ06507.1 hypothetical protein ENSA7_38260 [Enhygromyxa salina]